MWDSIRKLIVDPEAAGSSTTKRLAALAGRLGIPVEATPVEEVGRASPDRGAATSKHTLRLVRHPSGRVTKPCTGRTDSLLCCNLQVLTQTVGCPLDCSYCILQSYQNRSEITIQADAVPLLDELEQELAQRPRRLVRICTGQVADSLALEPELGFAAQAVERFADLDSGVLELKTKTDRVAFLAGLSHRGRTIVSWSLNPPDVIDAEERRSASLQARLAAASRMVDSGYLVAFHLDPMITLDGQPGPYLELVDRIFSELPHGAARVAYLSMGTVRFLPSMRRTITARFPGSRVTLAELLPDVDGKLRLLAPQRVALYEAVARRVRQYSHDLLVYLCMEPPRVWRRALGAGPSCRSELELVFAESLHRRFGLAPTPPEPSEYPGD